MRLPLGAAPEPRPRAVLQLASGLLVALAIGAALTPFDAWMRTGVALALLASAFLVHRGSSRPARPPRGWLTVDATGLARADEAGAARLLTWAEPFGVTVLANHDRSRLLFAVTTQAETRYIGVRVTSEADAAAAPALFARASTVADSDVRGTRGADDATLVAADGERLLHALRARSAAALDRIYLSDARGEPVVLDGTKLRLGQRTLDLTSPLEWRGFMFHESGGLVATVYQATWVRQGDAEAILVAPLPAESSWMKDLAESRQAPANGGGSDASDEASAGGAACSLAQRAVVRDLSLMQSAPEDPPARDLRLAIDRIFMLPLRQALDRAPRISRHPSTPPRPMRLGDDPRRA